MKVSDAPESFIRKQATRILGVEIAITRLEGKFKLGQETSPGDQLGTICGFRAMNTDQADLMAGMMEDAMKSETRRAVLEEGENKGMAQGPR